MMPLHRTRVCVLVAAGLLLAAAAPVPAFPAGQDQAVTGAGAFSAVEIRRLLDAYTVMQAQEFLGLTDAQFAQFLPRLKVLQETRRQQEQARLKLVQDINRLTGPGAPAVSDDALRDRLRALQDLDTRSTPERQKAYERLDEVLTIRQQARFRVFEERMERRQLELLLRARANPAARPRVQRPAAP